MSEAPERACFSPTQVEQARKFGRVSHLDVDYVLATTADRWKAERDEFLEALRAIDAAEDMPAGEDRGRAHRDAWAKIDAAIARAGVEE